MNADRVIQNIKDEMAIRDLSQRGLADLLGTTQTSVWRMLCVPCRLRVCDLVQIAEALDVSVSHLMKGS